MTSDHLVADRRPGIGMGKRVKPLTVSEHEALLARLLRSGDDQAALVRAVDHWDRYDLNTPKALRKAIADHFRYANKPKRPPRWQLDEQKMLVWVALHLVRLEGFSGATANRMVKRALAAEGMNYSEDSIPVIARRAKTLIANAPYGVIWDLRMKAFLAFVTAEMLAGTDDKSVPCLPKNGLVISTHDDPRTIPLPAAGKHRRRRSAKNSD